MENLLKQELQVFELYKPEWLENHEGEYVVIKGEDVIGFYEGELDAARIGFERCGDDSPILVKQITELEPVIYIKGENVPCLLSQ